MIKIKDLKKKFGKNEVLKGLSAEFNHGGIYSILGPNGSGKTTLLKLIMGINIPDSGTITVFDEDTLSKWEYREKIAYLPQIARFPANLKVYELINMIKDLRTQPSSEDELVNIFGLKTMLNQPLKNLSGGSIQKVNITITLMFDCPILILDEPTSGLDPVSLIRLKNLLKKLREKGKTILMTSHSMSLVEEISNEIIFIHDGKVYFRGKASQLMKDQDKLKLDEAIAELMVQNNAEDI